MVGLIATTLLAGARMPAGATSNMKRKIPRDAADRIAVAGPERDVRNLVPFLRREKCFFLTSPFIEPHPLTHCASRWPCGRSRPHRNFGVAFCAVAFTDLKICQTKRLTLYVNTKGEARCLY